MEHWNGPTSSVCSRGNREGLYTSSCGTTRLQPQCRVIVHSATRVGRTCVELDTCVRNSVDTDRGASDLVKVDKRL